MTPAREGVIVRRKHSGTENLMTMPVLADPETEGAWLADPVHRAFLLQDAKRQLDFFSSSLRPDGGFDVPDHDGRPLPRAGQELHITTRMVHSYVLGRAIGYRGADDIIDAGMRFLWERHRDPQHGGYLWSVDENGIHDDKKLAYGHVFVLLAASSAKTAGHPDADRLLADISEVLNSHFTEAGTPLLLDELARDWTPFSDYRGMNANMHGVEALLAAFEATDDRSWLARAGSILDFFTARMAPEHDWRIPEHYTTDWQVDPDYAGNPMFRPAGTTPGHSLEMARLVLQHWDLSGREDDSAPERAARLTRRALEDAWRADGGLVYTLKLGGGVDIADRYWWPVTEGIGVLASLQKAQSPASAWEDWYRSLWRFADAHFIDHERGGWFPELDESGQPASRQFIGKPDIYHALQADLLPLTPGLSRQVQALALI